MPAVAREQLLQVQSLPCQWVGGWAGLSAAAFFHEILELDACGMQGHEPLDEVFQFAHVSGPVVAHHLLQASRVQARRWLAKPGTNPGQKPLGQVGDVVHPLAQWMHAEGDYVDSEVEVLPEGSDLDHGPEVAVGG